jgi:hypothetical protein
LSCLSRANLLEIAEDENLPILLRESGNGATNRFRCFSASKRLMRRFAGRSENVEIPECVTKWVTLLPAI